MLREAATFWASRVTRGTGGRYHLNHITGPDEENAVHPEYAGYRGQLVKQADVTLMQYTWAFPMSRRVAQNDLDFYVPRSDPGGPSMTDAVSSIDSAALGTPGCASYVYTQRSVEPFLKDVFNQFSETRTGGAFTFMTGIGGFLQEFLYGYSGLRWNSASVHLDPSLTRQLSGIVLHNLAWRGRRFTVTIGLRRTTVRLDVGAPMLISTPSGSVTISSGHPASIGTRRPDLARTGDAVRCGTARATNSQPGAPALAAIDGSAATDWQPTSLPAITVARAASYTVQLSADGRHWRTVARIASRRRGRVDAFSFHSRRARFARLRITPAAGQTKPMLQELTLTG